MTFEEALREQLDKPSLTRHEKKIMAMLNEEPSKRRSRRLKRMEASATEAVRTGRAARGLSPSGPIDWADESSFGAIDWSAIFKILIQLLPLLLMIL